MFKHVCKCWHSYPDTILILTQAIILTLTLSVKPTWVLGLKIDPLRQPVGCRKRRLNQAPLNLRGLIWLLMMDWSKGGNIRKNSDLCSWQANKSWFKERRNPQAPNGTKDNFASTETGTLSVTPTLRLNIRISAFYENPEHVSPHYAFCSKADSPITKSWFDASV